MGFLSKIFKKVVPGLIGAGTGFITGGPAGALVGGLKGLGSSFAASEQNEMNLEAQENAQAWSAQEAAKLRRFNRKEAGKAWKRDQASANRQMNFERAMSNTSWQRNVWDLKKAGMNPMLGYMQGGASTPSGAAGNAPAAHAGAAGQAFLPRVHSPTQAAISGATGFAKLQAELKNIEADSNQKNAQALVNQAMVSKVQQDARVGVSSAAELDARTKKLNQEYFNLMTQRGEMLTNIDRMESERERNNFYTTKLGPLEAEIKILEARMLALSVPKAQLGSAAATGAMGAVKGTSGILDTIGAGWSNLSDWMRAARDFRLDDFAR